MASGQRWRNEKDAKFPEHEAKEKSNHSEAEGRECDQNEAFTAIHPGETFVEQNFKSEGETKKPQFDPGYRLISYSSLVELLSKTCKT